MSRVRDLASILTASSNMATDAELSAVSAQIPAYVAGKNLAINGAFDFWQRGTSFSMPTGNYTADRFAFAYNASPTFTISRQAFTAGDEPVASIASQYYLQNATTAVASAGITDWYHRIEDVSMLSGKTITVSYYARATIGTATLQIVVSQYNGTTYLDNAVQDYPTFVAGNGWRRYSTTLTLPTISRSSVTGTSHHTNIILRHFHSVTTFGVWGLQVELGSVATPFSRAGGDLQGELAKCQRYYHKAVSESPYGPIGTGKAYSSSILNINVPLPVKMRSIPSVTSGDLSALSTFQFETGATAGTTPTSIATNPNLNSSTYGSVDVTKTSAFTTGAFYYLMGFNNSNSFIGFNAEL